MNKLQELETKLKEAVEEVVKFEEKLRKEEVKLSKEIKLMRLTEEFEIIETTLSDLGIRYNEKKYENLKAGQFKFEDYSWNQTYANLFFEKDKIKFLNELIKYKLENVEQEQKSIAKSTASIEIKNKQIDILEKLKEE
jgi:hypothetical protein